MVIIQQLQHLSCTLAFKHIKQYQCTMITAEAKCFSFLFDKRNYNIIDVGNCCCLICPVICRVGNKPISWKFNTFWMAFRCGALIDQLHWQKLPSQGACKYSSDLSLVVNCSNLHSFCSFSLHGPLARGDDFCSSVIPINNQAWRHISHFYNSTYIS